MTFQPPGSNPHTTESSVPFASLRPKTTLSSIHRLEGQVVAISPDSPTGQAFAFTLASTHRNDGGMSIQVRFEGAWAREAARTLREKGLGRVLLLSASGGRVETRPLPKGKAPAEVPDGKRLRVVFRTGVFGAWRGEEGRKEDRFRFKGDPPAATPAARSFGSRGFPLASSSPPRPVPSSSRSSSTKENRPAPPTPLPLADKLSIPVGNPSNPYVGVSGAHPSAVLDFQYAPTPASASVEASQPAASAASSRDSGYEGSSPSLQRSGIEKGKGKAVETEREGALEQPDLGGSAGRKREPSGEIGAQAGGRKKARKERETRTTWGLQTDHHSYLALDALPQKNCSDQAVIAMAIVTKDPYRTRDGKGDWSIELQLFDPSAPTAATQVNYFAQQEDELPRPQDGNIVVLQRLNWSKDRHWFTAYKNKGEFRILPSSLLLHSDPPHPLSAFPSPPAIRAAQVDNKELAYARDLARWARKHDLLGNATCAATAAAAGGQGSERRAVPPKRKSIGRQLMRIEEMEEDQFCDTIAEIVKYYTPFTKTAGQPLDKHAQAALYVTDYTSHPGLADYTSALDSTVLGQRVLQVAIFGAQNEPLLARPQDWLRGKLVRLRNIRPKRNGGDSSFEATMMEDWKYPEKRDVQLVTDPSGVPVDWMAAFKKRREAYWKMDSDQRRVATFDSTAAATSAPKEEEEQKPMDPLSEISNLAGFPSPQPLAASVALGSPGTYRMRVRVADFTPNRLEEWVVAYCDECDRDLSFSETTCIEHNRVDYEWAFKLALADADEGAKEEDRILVSVDGDAAFSLFPSFSPSDFASLRAGQPSALHFRLRGILGDLDARKRRKQPLKEKDWGPAWDVVLEAVRTEGEGRKVEWRLHEGRVKFR
ncbi:hypothetical protein JCM6882_002193 [Rhodosporidiobolus microsporus]